MGKNFFKKMALFHDKVANTARDWHFKLAQALYDAPDNIFVEDINFNLAKSLRDTNPRLKPELNWGVSKP